jgi:hypothetical protein
MKGAVRSISTTDINSMEQTPLLMCLLGVTRSLDDLEK